MKKLCGIYKIENLVNGKVLIGLSSNIRKRWNHHRGVLKHNKHDNPHLQKAWNKYGENNFKFEVIFKCSIEKLNEEEIRLIKEYDTMNPKVGYNLKSGGNRPVCSEATKQRMRDVHKNRSPEMKKKLSEESSKARTGEGNTFFGKRHSEETKAKISKAKQGKKHSEEARENMGKAQIGRKHSEETKAKIRNYTLTKEQRKRLSDAKKKWWAENKVSI